VLEARTTQEDSELPAAKKRIAELDELAALVNEPGSSATGSMRTVMAHAYAVREAPPSWPSGCSTV
jgi:hypothetical protein